MVTVPKKIPGRIDGFAIVVGPDEKETYIKIISPDIVGLLRLHESIKSSEDFWERHGASGSENFSKNLSVSP
jgi:hypothetical protein